MNESQQRAWRALGLGPVWASREPAAAGVAAQAGERPGAASPAADAEVAAASGPDAGLARTGWTELRAAVAGCRACPLCEARTQTVFGVGNEQASWMLVGEAPGAEEDARGEPFVGQAGRLLDNMLSSIGLTRERDVFIANVLKCRPPRNRDPQPTEVARCEPFLKRQVELVAPKILLVMGRFAAQSLLQTEASIASLRGRVHRYEVAGRSVPVVVTYHPAYLLRNLSDKSKAWVDLCYAQRCLQEGG